MDCKHLKLFDPITNKCYGRDTKKGRELKLLIKVCRDYPNIDSNCKIINKLYKTKIIKLKQILKKGIIPIISILFFSIFVIFVLTSKKVRLKLFKFILKKNITNDYPILNPIIDLLPSLMNFIDNNGELLKAIIFNSNPIIIINTLYKNLLNNKVDFKKDFEDIPIKLPGAWPTGTIDNNITKILDNKNISDIDKFRSIFY